MLSVIALCAIPLLLLTLRQQVIRPISRLTSAISHAQNGDLDYRILKIPTSNEFDQINESFNSMMDQIQRLKVGVYEEKIEKQKIPQPPGPAPFCAEHVKYFILLPSE